MRRTPPPGARARARPRLRQARPAPQPDPPSTPPSGPTRAETKDTPDAPASAKRELEKLGPMSRDEKITAAAFAVTVALWIGGAAWGVNSVAAATVGLSVLLITGARRRGGGGEWGRAGAWGGGQ